MLAAAEEAISLGCALVKDNSSARQEDLAGTLDSLINVLYQAGHYQEAPAVI